MRLGHQGAIVTGVAGGIGAAVARRFADEGADVLGVDLHAPDPALGIADLPFAACDITDRKAVELMVAQVAQVNILAHAAARLGGSGPFLDTTDEDWHAFLHVNLTGSFVLCQTVARVMVAAGQGGRIITFGSVNSFAAEPDAAPYVASKGGMRMLTRAMAVELAADGIAVNMIAPGPITVARNAELFGAPSYVRHLERVVPMGRTGTPDEIAAVAMFLADPANTYVTGTEIVADGGMLAYLHGPDPA